MDLERLRYEKIFEEGNFSIIPEERHNENKGRTTIQRELRKLEDIEAFKIVDDYGQDIITSIRTL